MRTTISSAYPADDIIVFILIFVGVIYTIYFMLREREEYRSKHRAETQRQKYVRDMQNIVRLNKEQDAKDQETLDRATEYHNGI